MLTKLEIGFAILCSLLIAGGAIYLQGHHTGAKSETAKVAVKQAKTVAKHAKAVSHVQEHIEALPPAPTGSVASAVPGGANDELRRNWTRD